MKKCKKCLVEKKLTEFFKDAKMPDGHRNDCKQCKMQGTMTWRKNNKDRYNQLARDWRKKNPENVRKSDRKRNYGITHEQFEQLLIKQNFNCAICQNKLILAEKRKMHVDHDHATGAIRGLLCNNCNNGLGHFKDNNEYLKNAIKYLTKS